MEHQPAMAHEEPKEVGPARTPMDMARAYSGSHLISTEELDRLEAEERGKHAAEGPVDRLAGFEAACAGLGESLQDFARSYKTFGIHKIGKDEFSVTEWVPNARQVYAVGEFNSWDRHAAPLNESETIPGVWSGSISGLVKGHKYKLYIEPKEGEPYWALPAWCYRYVFTESTNLLDALYWPMDGEAPKPMSTPIEGAEKMYECHPGLAAREGKGASFAESTAMLLPRIKRNGYTSVLLVGVLECKSISKMGMQPVSLFAPARDLGTPEELRTLVATAHRMGLRVVMSIAHNGAASCEDGLGAQFFMPGAGATGFHKATGARLYNFAEKEVCRYMLSSLAYWVEEFGMDGFRFEDVTSTIYKDNGMFVPTDPKDFKEYLEDEDKLNGAGIQYLMMANKLIHEICPAATTICDENTLYPGACEPVAKGGLGFDIRQYSGAPELFKKNLTTKRDEDWVMSEMAEILTKAKTALPGEKSMGYTECAENCIVGQRPLRIAMLSWESLHTIAAGGVAPHVTELAGALHNAGHEVHIFTRSTNGTTWSHPVWGVMYHEVGFPTSGDFVQEIENMCSAFVGHYLYMEGQVPGGFDIVHGHDWLVGPAASQLAAMGKRTVFTMHSTETGRCGNNVYAGQSARIRSIEGHACHATGRVIAVSGVLKEEVCNHYGVDGRKIDVIYNGIHAESIANMEWQDAWTGNTKQDKGFDVMAPMFLFVGRLAVQKGPDLLLDAIPMILQARGDAKFVIVGDGHMKAALEGRAHQMGISHAVCFAGSVKSGSAHLKALLKSCDAVVVPSRNEPFGIVVLEAWAAGKPVVATTCGGPRDFVLPDKDGYLVDPDPGSIAWGCCKICENFDHARWMGQRAQNKALQEFNWEFIARQTEDIYYQQMGMGGAPRCRTSGGAPHAAYVLGPHRDGMGVMDNNHLALRGLSILKQYKLVAATMGSDAVMTWMGSEYGQIDSVDLRGEFRMSFDNADNKGLKYKHLEMFELCLNRTEAILKWLSAGETVVLVKDEEAKVLIYTRGGCVFALNFNPAATHDGYKVKVPASVTLAPELSVVLNSEDVRFGGEVAMPKAPAKISSKSLAVTLTPRSAIVYAPADKCSALTADEPLQSDTDEIMDTPILGA